MRIATWNVNSVKQRVPRLLPWLDQRRPDVLCLQETKLADEAFAELLGDALAERGYDVAAHGEATWNGVAIVSRVGLDEVVRGLEGAPGFPHPEARAIAATCGGIRVVSVYVPNGRVPGSEHYQYKLAWLASLREMVAAGPEAIVVCGDMNIAPTDDDVFDPDAYIGETHVTPPERAALAELQALGLRDVVRDRWPNERVRHVPPSLAGVVLVHVQQRLKRVGDIVDRGVTISYLRKASGHRRDGEVLGRDLGELVPRQRRGDRRTRLRPDAVGRGDGAI